MHHTRSRWRISPTEGRHDLYATVRAVSMGRSFYANRASPTLTMHRLDIYKAKIYWLLLQIPDKLMTVLITLWSHRLASKELQD